MAKIVINQGVSTTPMLDNKIEIKDKFNGAIAQAISNKPTCQVDIYTKTTTKDTLVRMIASPLDKNRRQMQINYSTTVTSVITPKKANGEVDSKAFVRLDYEKNWLINIGKNIVVSETGKGIMSTAKTFTSLESRRYEQLNPIIREDVYDNRIYYNGNDTALYFRNFVSNVSAQCIIDGKDVKPTYNTPEQRLKKTKMKSSD